MTSQMTMTPAEAAPEIARRPNSRTALVLAIGGAVLAFAAITALVFLARAGNTGWPFWDLQISDNGVLFQLAQDLFAGRRLDWSFSPQVYVFPEIPISLAAYAIGGGSVYWYFLLVACIDNALLFGIIVALLRAIYPGIRPLAMLLRSGLAGLPLVLFPLFDTAETMAYPLAPTYYIGVYAMIFAAPLLFLARTRWARIALVAAMALTGASNPLVFIFVIPAFAVIAIALWVTKSFSTARGPALLAAGVVVLAFAIRTLFFSSLVGTSPLSYISISIFVSRVQSMVYVFHAQLQNATNVVLIGVGMLLAVAGMVVAVVLIRRVRRAEDPRILLTAVYFGLVPIGGLVMMFGLLIAHRYYLWPVLFAPYIFALLWVPSRWVRPAAAAALALMLIVALSTHAYGGLKRTEKYFSYRNAATRCLDSKLPAGHTLGYATFSDARSLELTSRRDFRMIQIGANAGPSNWLTNKAYATDSVGTFFYLNAFTNETPIDPSIVYKAFGKPDSSFSCGPGRDVAVYTNPAKIAKIRAFYLAFKNG